MNQRGFAPILLLIIGILVFAGGYFYYQSQYTNQNGILDSNLTKETIEQNNPNERIEQDFIGDSREFPKPPLLEEWNQYTGNGISLKYPPTLHAEESDVQTSFLYYYKSPSDNNRIVTELGLYLITRKTEQTSLQKYQEWLLNQPQSNHTVNYEDFKILKVGEHEVLNYQSSALGTYLRYVFLNAGNVYEISTYIDSVKDQNFKETLQQILETVTFTDDLSSNISDIKGLLGKIDIDEKLNIPSGQHGIADVIKVSGDWVKIEARLVDSTNTNIGGGPKIIGHKVNGIWEFAFEGESKYEEWKDQLPYSLQCISTSDDC